MSCPNRVVYLIQSAQVDGISLLEGCTPQCRYLLLGLYPGVPTGGIEYQYLFNSDIYFFLLVSLTEFVPVKQLPVYNYSWKYINLTGATSGVESAYPPRAPEFAPGFQWGSCYIIFSFMCLFCRSLFVFLSFFFWPIVCSLPIYGF